MSDAKAWMAALWACYVSSFGQPLKRDKEAHQQILALIEHSQALATIMPAAKLAGIEPKEVAALLAQISSGKWDGSQYTPLEVLFDELTDFIGQHVQTDTQPGGYYHYLTKEGEAKLRELLAVYTAKMRKAIHHNVGQT